ncbi:MAG: DNA translocase FtsK 4TM domain-containing protein [Gammaproteobacteria bacterium]|nr:DNA translocase FtsK 4TM domain-containing protein [Gammaproteobacteria bacterium]
MFVLVALVSHSPADPGWSHTGAGRGLHNLGGIVGAYLADVLLYLFGYVAYLFPAMIGFAGWLVYRLELRGSSFDYFYLTTRGVGFVLTVALGCGLAWLQLHGGGVLPHESGGITGDVIARLLLSVFGGVGGTLMMLALFLTGVTLFTGLSWIWVMDATGRCTLAAWDWLRIRGSELADRLRGLRARREREAVVKVEQRRIEKRPKPRIEPAVSTFEIGERVEKEKQKILFEEPPETALPPLALLEAPPGETGGGYAPEVLEAMSRQVELKLRDFGVEAQVVAVHPGPVITRFELEPAPGVKASRITGLAKDLARSLSTVSVRVVEVIPGKSVIGLEIPNERRETVYLREILSSREYDASHSHLTLALGKDIGGRPVVVDLARMPHLLVAGTTGSGKSVALNAMILSLLYKSTPVDVRLVMIDPKMLELSVYEGIPALLAPVVTDMREAANALRWSVAEMERRYRLMATLGVRNIGGYNRKVLEAIERGQPLADPFAPPPFGEDARVPTLDKLPYIVVIVDELADMMMTVGKKVEELIARLAQKARAAGIHLILATQRPSVDVITGLIKANIPSRIAFQVSSRVDSRTILDQMGAETLLGHGDMLYLPPGTGLPTRVHGAFVADQEVHKVVEELKRRGAPDYVDAVLEGPAETGDDVIPGLEPVIGDGESDALYDQAVRIVTETRRASVSGVQRRLKIGYNRAARLIEEMERAGIVGAMQSNGSREVLAPPPPKD